KTILPHVRSLLSAAEKNAAPASTSHRESQLRPASWTRPARTINRSLARDVDPAAISSSPARHPLVASRRISLHSSPDHAECLPRRDRKTNCASALVLSRRSCDDSRSFAASSGANRPSCVDGRFLIRRWTLGSLPA